VTNRSRSKQIFDNDSRLLRPANAPLVSDPDRLIGDYTNPILKPEAAEAVKKWGDVEANGVGHPTPWTE
jgi:hypothetical protein